MASLSTHVRTFKGHLKVQYENALTKETHFGTSDRLQEPADFFGACQIASSRNLFLGTFFILGCYRPPLSDIFYLDPQDITQYFEI